MFINKISVSILTIVLCISVTYFNSLTGSFHYDDNHHIERNFNIRKLGNIPSFYTDPRMFSANSEDAMYRPFLMTTFAVNYFFGGNNTTGFHIVNIALHALNSILLFLIFSLIFKPNRLVSLAVSLIYAVHPVNTEAVNYLSSRSDVMSTTFILISFYLFIKNRFYLFVLVSYILGLLTKEVAATLPLFMLSYDILFGINICAKRDAGWLKSAITHWKRRHLPIWIITGCYLLLRKNVFTGSVAGVFVPTSGIASAPNTLEIGNKLLYILTQIKVALNYIRLWFVPTNLTIEHDYPLVSSPAELSLLISIFLFLVIVFLAVRFYKKDRRVTFFFIWFIISLLPTSLNVLNVVMAEKRVYLAGIGLAGMLAAGIGLLNLQNVSGETGRKIVIGVSITVILTFAFSTISRNRVWQNEISLWTDAFNKKPSAPVASQLLAEALLKEGRFAEGIELFKKSILIAPSGSRYNGLGIALYRNRQVEEAARSFERAIALEPKRSDYYTNLANIFYGRKEYLKAIKLYRQAIAARPESSYAYSNLGNTYFAMGEYDNAISSYKKAVEIDPANYKAIKNIERISGLKNMTHVGSRGLEVK